MEVGTMGRYVVYLRGQRAAAWSEAEDAAENFSDRCCSLCRDAGWSDDPCCYILDTEDLLLEA
jgi:hypothetical protein